ncbi:MAG TPA: hypothetical protein PK668_06695 [Myxococcota bacterium]|nr:hypothetical protein [Myxococcota bacterium]HRY92469.1 hypothetical protein [Myxococcota bacterium]HSA23836.1 hypothetical protein [Myxococcota bacterium]
MRRAGLVLWLLLLPGLAQADPGQADVRRALWLGMEHMTRSAVDPAHFARYASDYLFFLADLQRVEDPWLQARARELGRELGARYLAVHFTLDSADEVVDAASALWALDELGLDVDAPLALLREAARGFPARAYWGFDPARGELPDLDRLIDLLIGLHFTERLEVPVGVSYAEALVYAAGVDYGAATEEDEWRYVELNNLATHVVYTLSGYAGWGLEASWLPRERAYLLANLDRALAWGDPETLAEYADCLLILGHSPDEPGLRAARALLVALQRPDGGWAPEGTPPDGLLDPADSDLEYDRYHATWCAMDALRDYDLLDPPRLPDPLTRRVLAAWAGQLQAGLSLDPWLPISPDRRPDEEE